MIDLSIFVAIKREAVSAMNNHTTNRCRVALGQILGAVFLVGLTGMVSAQTQSVTGEGLGMTHGAALSAAKRDAVEKGVGVVVASETLVKNFQVVDDRILSKANGFVKTFQELSSGQGPDGMWTVRISADVTDILDEVVKDQLALDLLLSWVRHPRFMIMIDETNIDDRTSTVAATEIGRLLGQKGFDLVSPRQSEALRQRNVNLAAVQGDEIRAASIAAESGAEYLILGTATARTVPVPYATTRLSGQANITAKVIRADNAQIMAQETFHGRSTHIDAQTAGIAALKDAAADLSEYLLMETVKRWSLEQSNARLLTLKISGLTYQSRKQVSDFLKSEVEGVQSVDQRSFAGGVVTLAVQFGGSNEDLGFQLDGKDLGSFILQIMGETPNGFELTAQAK